MCISGLLDNSSTASGSSDPRGQWAQAIGRPPELLYFFVPTFCDVKKKDYYFVL